jgi:SOS-response transcriptional repressor LexA
MTFPKAEAHAKRVRRTEKILKAIREIWIETGIPATIREVQETAGISSGSTVVYHLGILEKEGKIRERPTHQTRGIVPTRPDVERVRNLVHSIADRVEDPHRSDPGGYILIPAQKWAELLAEFTDG